MVNSTANSTSDEFQDLISDLLLLLNEELNNVTYPETMTEGEIKIRKNELINCCQELSKVINDACLFSVQHTSKESFQHLMKLVDNLIGDLDQKQYSFAMSHAERIVRDSQKNQFVDSLITIVL